MDTLILPSTHTHTHTILIVRNIWKEFSVCFSRTFDEIEYSRSLLPDRLLRLSREIQEQMKITEGKEKGWKGGGGKGGTRQADL